MNTRMMAVTGLAAILLVAGGTANAALIGSMSAPASTYNVSDGTIDWIAIKGDGALARKNTTNVLAITGYFDGGVYTTSTTTTWSDGAPPNANGTASFIYPRYGMKYTPYVITAPNPGVGKTYEIEVLLGCFQYGGGYGPITVTASVSGDGGSYSQAFDTNGGGERLFTFDYSGGDLTISENINYMWSPSFQFASLSAVPEPATVGLLALGGLAVLKRRRGLAR